MNTVRDEWRALWSSNNATEMHLLHQTSELLSSMGKHKEALLVALREREMANDEYGEEEHERSMVDVGNAHLHSGDVRAAKLWYGRVVSLHPRSLTGLNNYAAACYRLGEYESSLLSFRAMLKIDGRDKRANEGLKALANFATRYDRR